MKMYDVYGECKCSRSHASKLANLAVLNGHMSMIAYM